MKIAVLSYGSLTLNLKSRYFSTALEIDGEFQESNLMISTSFQDMSTLTHPEQSRLCLLATNTSSSLTRYTQLYYATHASSNFEEALANFMAREGTENPEHVAIVRHPKSSHSSTYSKASFHQGKIQEIERWIAEHNYDVAFIAQFPTEASLEEVHSFLNQDPATKERTLLYFHGLPESTQHTHRDALELLGIEFDQDTDMQAI